MILLILNERCISFSYGYSVDKKLSNFCLLINNDCQCGCSVVLDLPVMFAIRSVRISELFLNHMTLFYPIFNPFFFHMTHNDVFVNPLCDQSCKKVLKETLIIRIRLKNLFNPFGTVIPNWGYD